MRVLFLSPRQCWPAISGAKLRDYYFARALGQRHELTYLHFREPGAPAIPPGDLPFARQVMSVSKPNAYSAAKIARGLIGRWPLPILDYTSPEMDRILRQVLTGQRYDLVHLDIVQLAGYAAAIDQYAGGKARIVYNWHNIESELLRRYSQSEPALLRRMYAAWTAPKMERVERTILRSSFGHVVCSEEERHATLAVAPDARVAVVENGVDTTYFAGAPGGNRNRIVFVGSMDYFPNIEAAVLFARDIWPQVRKRLPDYRFTIVGSKPDPSVLALSELPGVEVTGTVPDVRPYYREALATVVPLRTGGGTRLKILESMAAGVPVVSTEFGAERLAVEPGKHIILANADDPQAWAGELAALADSTSRRQSFIEAAARLVRERYDWNKLGDLLCRTYDGWLEQAG